MTQPRYEVRETIARSSRTVVRRAVRTSDGAPVVIKTPARDYPTVRELGQLEFEYRILNKLRSKGIVRALDLEREAGRLALVLEDFGGERLPTGDGAGIALDVFFEIAAELTRLLGHVHAHNVIHKDINPHNVLMNPVTRELKLIDFSLASELGREHLEIKLPNQLEGTLAYISPEQTGRMNRDLDYRSDYYSLGVTFFELLAGVPPFSANDLIGFVHCHIGKPAPNLRDVKPEVPEGLSRIVAKLMAKDPDERYQSARGLLEDLSRAEREWTESGEVAGFVLGAHDLSDRFHVSQKLVGREAEVQALISVFDATSQGTSRLLLVSGYSGIGKSSLIHQIHRPVVDKRASFVSGKFEQVERNAPYGAWIQALRELVKQVLAEPEEALALARQRLSAALGGNGAVLTAMLPELEQVIGPQPAVMELPAREAQSRLHRVFRDFIQAVATAAHPLVIFLDDLQWADGGTPQLLVHLLGDDQLSHLLVIGAYRDNEVGEGHLLHSALLELGAKRADAIAEIRLSPLSPASLNRLVADTLRSEPSLCEPLSDALYQKTAGNPFFSNELLGVLYREGALRFAAAEARWVWDDAKVAQAAVTDNVADLMLVRMKGLSKNTVECLCLGSCLGNEFDLGTLARVAERPAREIGAALWEAVEEQLLYPIGDGYRLLGAEADADDARLGELTVRYRFPHDRVHQAVASLLEEERRSRVHLRIGRLLREAAGTNREERVFDFVDHLNLGRRLLSSVEERDDLAELNYVAAQRARRAAAYAVAVAYLESSLSLLSEDEWAERPVRRFEIQRVRVECISLSGQAARAAELVGDLADLAYDEISGASVCCLKAAIEEHRSQLHEAVETISRGLRLLGVELPGDPELVGKEIGAGVGKLKGHLDRVAIEDLVHLPEMTDRAKIATMELLFQLIPPASQANVPLFILSELILFDLALTHGVMAGSAKNFVDCGIVLGTMLNDYPGAYRMGKVAFALLERHAPTPLESPVNFVFGCFIAHWGAGVQEALDALSHGYQRGVELGDVLHASYSIVHRAKCLLFAGRELGECQAQNERAAAYTLAAGAVGQHACARVVGRALGQLLGGDTNRELTAVPDDVFIEQIRKTDNAHMLFVLGETQLLTHFVLGDFEAARKWLDFVTPLQFVGNGTLPVPDHELFASLLLAEKCRTAPEAERAELLPRLAEHLAKLRHYADVCPRNFAHKYKLAAAEIARTGDEPMDRVLGLYAEALAAAGEDVLHLRALTNELEAGYLQERGHDALARACIHEAYYLYRRWGAKAKLERLEVAYPLWLGRAGAVESPASSLFQRTTSRYTVEASALDLVSVLKATHAVSSEVRPDRLFEVLMATIIENAGAQRGYLIVKSEDSEELCVEAAASIADPGVAPARGEPLADCDGVSQDMVRFVARTHQTVVLDDARKDPLYGADPRVKGHDVRSVLCMPILNGGKLLAILYVENNAVTRAFTPERLSLLQIIAGQAAISIANAKLYENLEHKVAERTRQLREQGQEVSALLNSMQQGVFNIDERLAIQPQYSAHLEQLLGTAEIAGKDCLELLFQDSLLGRDALKTQRSALEFSFGVPLELAESNMAHLIGEFERRSAGAMNSFEIEWTPIVDADDSVRKILVTLRDVTALRALRATAARSARELDIVGQILDAGIAEFERFSTSARGFLAESKASLAGDSPLTQASFDRLFRNLHTVKGNAQMLGLEHLTIAAHEAEECLDALRRASGAALDRTALDAALDSVEDGIAEYARVAEQKLAPLPKARDRKHERAISAIAGRVSEHRQGALGAAAALSAIERALASADAVPLSDVVARCARMLPGVARELDKLSPAVEAHGALPLLTPAFARAMEDVLMHVFRNAVDHGIEGIEERQRRGKPEQGKISVRVEGARNGRPCLRLSDDGRGLALEALRARTGDVGSDALLAATVFAAGVTTASEVTAISGRGVGLNAVRSFMRSHGGDVEIVFTSESREGHREFELVFELPRDALLDDELPAQSSRAPSRHPRPLISEENR